MDGYGPTSGWFSNTLLCYWCCPSNQIPHFKPSIVATLAPPAASRLRAPCLFIFLCIIRVTLPTLQLKRPHDTTLISYNYYTNASSQWLVLDSVITTLLQDYNQCTSVLSTPVVVHSTTIQIQIRHSFKPWSISLFNTPVSSSITGALSFQQQFHIHIHQCHLNTRCIVTYNLRILYFNIRQLLIAHSLISMQPRASSQHSFNISNNTTPLNRFVVQQVVSTPMALSQHQFNNTGALHSFKLHNVIPVNCTVVDNQILIQHLLDTNSTIQEHRTPFNFQYNTIPVNSAVVDNQSLNDHRRHLNHRYVVISTTIQYNAGASHSFKLSNDTTPLN